MGPPHQSILDEFFNSFLVLEENSQSLLVQIQKSHILIFTETIILSSESANKKKRILQTAATCTAYKLGENKKVLRIQKTTTLHYLGGYRMHFFFKIKCLFWLKNNMQQLQFMVHFQQLHKASTSILIAWCAALGYKGLVH